ncbi:MAG: DUF2282 domain-containing protein [Gallionella sp.]
MNKTDLTIRTAVAGLLALGLAANSTAAFAAKADMEKCAGIVKAGQNDCASAGNACAGHTTKDNEPSAWIAVPKGTCAKIAGGMLVAKMDDGKMDAMKK